MLKYCTIFFLHSGLIDFTGSVFRNDFVQVQYWSLVEQFSYMICVWLHRDDLKQKWNIKVTVTSKWVPPINFPLLFLSTIISLISATLGWQRRGNCLHSTADELLFKFITSRLKNINKERVAESARLSKVFSKWWSFFPAGRGLQLTPPDSVQNKPLLFVDRTIMLIYPLPLLPSITSFSFFLLWNTHTSTHTQTDPHTHIYVPLPTWDLL